MKKSEPKSKARNNAINITLNIIILITIIYGLVFYKPINVIIVDQRNPLTDHYMQVDEKQKIYYLTINKKHYEELKKIALPYNESEYEKTRNQITIENLQGEVRLI